MRTSVVQADRSDDRHLPARVMSMPSAACVAVTGFVGPFGYARIPRSTGVKAVHRGEDVIICHSRRFVYLHLHKTAGESVTATLRPVLVAGDLEVRGKPEVSVNGTALTKHSTALDTRTALGAEVWERYFTFSFVRHPFDRTLSLYRYIADLSEPPTRSLAQRIGLRSVPTRADRSDWPEVRAFRATGSVSEFIRHPALEHAVSMRSQASSLGDDDGTLLVDFVGRYERIAEDVAHVQETLGLPVAPLRSVNVSHRRRDVGTELSPDDRAYLAARFEEDFARFGYRP